MANAQAIVLEVGTQIYNHGDQANSPHFGTITEVRTDKYGVQVKIQPEDIEIKPYWSMPCEFSQEYKGHGGTRIVLRDAYAAWVRKSQDDLRAWVNKSKVVA